MRPEFAFHRSSQLAHAALGGGGATSPATAEARVRASGVDLEIGQLFTDLRLYLGWTVENAARQLATRPEIIRALERGDFDRLPPWPETQRLVTAFASHGNVSPEAILRRLWRRVNERTGPVHERLGGYEGAATPTVPGAAGLPSGGGLGTIAGRLARPRARDGAGPAPQADFKAVGVEVLHGLRGGLNTLLKAPRRLFLLSADRLGEGSRAIAAIRPHARAALLAAALLAVLVSAVPLGGVLQASVNRLPAPVSGVLSVLTDQIVLATSPVREGHRWIEVDDPRSRRADKLPVRRH